MTDIAASHRHRLGCSELAAALGVSPWKTPYGLWLEKTGRAEPPKLNGLFKVDLGHHLEALVGDLYARRFGVKVQRDSREYRHPDLPLVGHIDRRILGQRAGLEIKTSLGRFTSEEWGEEGTDQIPAHYLAQCLGYLWLTGWERWDVAALLAGPELRVYTIRPELDLFALLEAGIRAFWRHVEFDTPPDPTTLADTARRWPTALASQIEIDAETAAALAELRMLKADIAAREQQAEALEIRIKTALGEHEALVDPATGAPLCTWKNQTSRRLNTTALREAHPDLAATFTTETQSRVFRLSQEKTK